jgi:hypothetical protein
MDELKAAVEATERKAFEAWISALPFYNVELAWCAWKERAARQRPCRGVAHAGCGSTCNKCEQAV